MLEEIVKSVIPICLDKQTNLVKIVADGYIKNCDRSWTVFLWWKINTVGKLLHGTTHQRLQTPFLLTLKQVGIVEGLWWEFLVKGIVAVLTIIYCRTSNSSPSLLLSQQLRRSRRSFIAGHLFFVLCMHFETLQRFSYELEVISLNLFIREKRKIAEKKNMSWRDLQLFL